MNAKLLIALSAMAVGVASLSLPARGGEDAVAVDTSGLKPLGKSWVMPDPYRDVDHKRAIEVGMSGYNQNCARCHGLEVKSGGFVPDLRYLPTGAEGDSLFTMRMANGAQKNGRVEMPAFMNILPQEVLWSIRTYVESVHIDQ